MKIGLQILLIIRARHTVNARRTVLAGAPIRLDHPFDVDQVMQRREHPFGVLPRLFGYPLLFRVRVCGTQRFPPTFPISGSVQVTPRFPPAGPDGPRFPAFKGTIEALRLPAPLGLRPIDSPTGSAGACRVRVRPRTLPSACRPTDGPGCGLFMLAIPVPAALPTGKSRISQVPWRSIPRLCADPRPRTTRRALANSGASGAAPRPLNTEGAIVYPISRLPRRFIVHCLRFTTPVTVRHARLVSGWRAAPLPGGSRTRWIATRGFSSCHPPPPGLIPGARSVRATRNPTKSYRNRVPAQKRIAERRSLG